MTTESLLSDEMMDAFDYSFDLDEEQDQQLSWRLDPIESHSDWTIVIKYSFGEDTYHVHKNILAVGPCKSDYFSSLFRSTHLSESQTSTSSIVLQDSAAQSMPVLLDFMYDPNHKLEISTQHVVALRYLAKYFGIRILYRKVMDFIKKDLSLNTISTYIADAMVFGDETTLSLASTKCIDNLDVIADALLQQMDPTFFLRILSNPEVDTCSVSCRLSILLGTYCQLHKDELTEDLFQKLTDRKFIPQIDRQAAIDLLEMEVAICNSNTCGREEASCLQKRCIKVLALYWKDLSDENKETFYKLPSTVLVELLERTLRVAKQNIADVERSNIADSAALMDRVEYLEHEANEKEKRHKEELLKCQQEAREKQTHLRSLLAEKDRQIMEYRREWDKLVRVPPCERLSTYHHLSGNEPFDNPRQNHYGRLRPTAMPRIGDSSEDGYLVVDAESHKRWPVYYYKDE